MDDSFCGGLAHYIQGTNVDPASPAEELAHHLSLLGSKGEFVCRFGEGLFPDFDFGDGGIVYVHRRGAWLDMC